MSDIYALFGRSGTGKSTTVRIIYDDLVRRYPANPPQILQIGRRDVAAIFRGINGHVVGIESEGDPGPRLAASLAQFHQARCTVMICAVRGLSARAANYRVVQSYAPAYNVQFIPQLAVAPAQQQANNWATAQNIMRQAGI
jgi:hypothetical protein